MKNIKIFTLSILAASFIVLSGFTTAGNESAIDAMSWNIDKAHSNISFEVRHIFTPVSGQFQNYSADINFNPDDLSESSINMRIMVNSIDTDNERRDGHLQSGDFFNAEKYPEITFESEKITKEGDNKFVAHGTLTMKEVTKNIELPFTLLGMQDHPQKENTKIAGVKIDHTINRNDYNVGTGSYAETAVIGGDIDISIALEMQHTSK